jgi:hypothetical protein
MSVFFSQHRSSSKFKPMLSVRSLVMLNKVIKCLVTKDIRHKARKGPSPRVFRRVLKGKLLIAVLKHWANNSHHCTYVHWLKNCSKIQEQIETGLNSRKYFQKATNLNSGKSGKSGDRCQEGVNTTFPSVWFPGGVRWRRTDAGIPAWWCRALRGCWDW